MGLGMGIGNGKCEWNGNPSPRRWRYNLGGYPYSWLLTHHIANCSPHNSNCSFLIVSIQLEQSSYYHYLVPIYLVPSTLGYTRPFKGYTRKYKGYTRPFKGYTRKYKGYTRPFNGYPRKYKGIQGWFMDNLFNGAWQCSTVGLVYTGCQFCLLCRMI